MKYIYKKNTFLIAVWCGVIYPMQNNLWDGMRKRSRLAVEVDRVRASEIIPLSLERIALAFGRSYGPTTREKVKSSSILRAFSSLAEWHAGWKWGGALTCLRRCVSRDCGLSPALCCVCVCVPVVVRTSRGTPSCGVSGSHVSSIDEIPSTSSQYSS